MESDRFAGGEEADLEERRRKLAEWYDQYGLVQELILDAELVGVLKRGKEWIESFRTEMVGQLAGEVRGRKVLDVGCHYGIFSFYMLERGASVTGIDIAEKWVQRCSEQAREKHPGGPAEFLVADAQALPFGDESFDVVICLEVVEHVDFPGKVMSEVHRVLRPGGVLVVGTPNTSSYYVAAYKLLKGVLPMKTIRKVIRKIAGAMEDGLKERLRSQLPPEARELFDVEVETLKVMGQGLDITDPEREEISEHIREFSVTELENLLDFCGFEVEKRTGFPYFPTYFFMHIRLWIRKWFVKVKDDSWWRCRSAPQVYLRAVRGGRSIFLD